MAKKNLEKESAFNLTWKAFLRIYIVRTANTQSIHGLPTMFTFINSD